MRCPKCGFNSFDHNPACPKCRRDLTAARRLLNLSVPAPGTVDFFKTAAHTAVFPEPFVLESLLEELEIVPEAVDTVETIEAMEPAALSPAVPAPIQAETEDIEPIGEIEEIEPDTEEAGLEDEEIEPADEEEDIAPLGAAEEEPIEDIYPDAATETPDEDEDISPLDHDGGSFAQRLAEAQAQAAVSPADDEAIEIEPDEIEVLEAEPVDDDFDADPGIPPFVESALSQVKSTLIATGDLAADDDAEQEPELWLEPETPAEAEPEVEAAAVPEESDIIDVAAIPEPSPDETRKALDDDFLDGDIDALSSLMENLDIDDIDKKI